MTRRLEGFLTLYVAVVLIQGTHFIEHVIQLAQVYAWGIPDDNALGLLGNVFQFQGTEEWLHLVFNGTFLVSLYLLTFYVKALTPSVVSPAAFRIFFVGGVGLETWHMAEHLVIISNVLAHQGCPCPGILDPVLGVSDTILHFVYNTAVYASILVPFWHVMQAGRRALPTAGLRPFGPRVAA